MRRSPYFGRGCDERDERRDDAVVGRPKIRSRRRQLMLQSDFRTQHFRNLFGVMTQLQHVWKWGGGEEVVEDSSSKRQLRNLFGIMTQLQHEWKVGRGGRGG